MAFNAQRVSKILALHLIEREKERVVLFSSLALVTCVALKLNFEPFIVLLVTILSGFECAHEIKMKKMKKQSFDLSHVCRYHFALFLDLISLIYLFLLFRFVNLVSVFKMC